MQGDCDQQRLRTALFLFSCISCNSHAVVCGLNSLSISARSLLPFLATSYGRKRSLLCVYKGSHGGKVVPRTQMKV